MIKTLIQIHHIGYVENIFCHDLSIYLRQMFANVSKHRRRSTIDQRGRGIHQFTTNPFRSMCPLLLTWFNFNPSMDK